ncbi:hypothetical protein [Actinosynnema pretiosum]|uniref:Uncharacterized protein n=1 Tax=Actinosynnema pretiosum TaxID=42197 RepID=A0A290ZBQ5_9PSEU|nr:hypothetical protein [Actinosynnema pretiosum]ATE56427.1 hypothetical protein CNX65_26735 [Actinosynnema pretiosum]
MDPQQSNRAAYTVNRGLFDAFTAPSDNPAVQPPRNLRNTILSLCLPGWAARPQDFTDAWSPDHRAGGTATARRIASVFGDVPKADTAYTSTGHRLEEVYGFVVDAELQVGEADHDQEARYERAYRALHRAEEVADPASADCRTHTVPTDAYRAYLRHAVDHDNARAAHNHARQHGELAEEEFDLVRRVFLQMERDGGREIRQELATLATTTRNVVARAFADARERFASAELDLDGVPTRLSELIPADWAVGGGVWGSARYGAEAVGRVGQAEADAWAWHTGIADGIWSRGAERVHSDTPIEGMELTFEFTSVAVYRPWLQFLLLGMPGWEVPGMGPGELSQGLRGDNSRSWWPLLTTAFLAVRDLRIRADWGPADRDLIASAREGAALGWGPFQVAGEYAHQPQGVHDRVPSELLGDELVVPGAQVVGVLGQVVPFSPPGLTEVLIPRQESLLAGNAYLIS